MHGQKTIFQENVNYNARELNQSLNKNGDSLFFKSEKIISQIDIFNENFTKSIKVNTNESKIDLSTIPIGKFIVQARIERKRIIMYLVRIKHLDSKTLKTESESIVTSNDLIDNNSLESGLSSEEPSHATIDKRKTSYWVVYESNSNLGSSKSMSLENADKVAKLISKNKLELNTEIAKHNRLIVYEVYNTSKFMRKQLRKSNYFKSSSSIDFNVEPYYSSTNSIESNLSK